MADICQRVTGLTDYTVDFDNTGYNIGRLAILEYDGRKTLISFSELEIKGRNSSFQSFPSALSRYILDENTNKEICFYFHPDTQGNWETPYFIFMYRLMQTANVKFLNGNDYLNDPISPFTTPEDIILHKDQMRSKNSGNKSTYLTRGNRNQLQIFGKTYGANKYETTLLCLAISEIASRDVELYEIEEGGLTKLPEKSKNAIESLGVVQIFTSNMQIERVDFEENNSLRSASYIYNLLEKLGEKKCALCKCDIPQIIQGAHIWPVADIKKETQKTIDEKLALALDGDNGLWLCQNHHKLLDVNILRLFEDGTVKCKESLSISQSNYVKTITEISKIPTDIITDRFSGYLAKRNQDIPEDLYSELVT